MWIISILEFTRISVLVNGTQTNKFSLQIGLRQGDPLSPSLFNLIDEVLYVLLIKVVDLGIFSGIKLREEGENISHLQFMDDTINLS